MRNAIPAKKTMIVPSQAKPERPSRLRGWFERIGQGFRRLVPAKLKAARQSGQPGFFRRFHNRFERGFEKFSASYRALVTAAIDRGITFAVAGGVLSRRRAVVVHRGGLFPPGQGEQMTLHVRTRPGMRIERPTAQFAGREHNPRDHSRKGARARSRQHRIAGRNYNLAFNDGTFVAYNDGQILVSLKSLARSDRSPT